MSIYLRDIKKTDWDFILELRNQNYEFFYLQNEPLKKEEHYEYMEMLEQKSVLQKIVVFEEQDSGYVRVKDNNVSIIVKKNIQGRGVATEALKLIEHEAKKRGIQKLTAWIKIENVKSEKAFRNNGYVHVMNWLEKEI